MLEVSPQDHSRRWSTRKAQKQQDTSLHSTRRSHRRRLARRRGQPGLHCIREREDVACHRGRVSFGAILEADDSLRHLLSSHVATAYAPKAFRHVGHVAVCRAEWDDGLLRLTAAPTWGT